MARIDQVFQPWAASQPQQVALADSHRIVCYGELDAIIDAAVAQLQASGVRRGDRVLLVAENSVALAVMILAVSRAGAWSATVNARLSVREITNFIAVQ